jgi:hypothetical protein
LPFKRIMASLRYGLRSWRTSRAQHPTGDLSKTVAYKDSSFPLFTFRQKVSFLSCHLYSPVAVSRHAKIHRNGVLVYHYLRRG